MRQQIEARTGRQVAIGAVYATLARLDEYDLVSAKVGEPQAMRGGRARKCYRLTPAGTRALTAATGMLRKMMHGWRPAYTRS